jgi:hypothetical protein
MDKKKPAENGKGVAVRGDLAGYSGHQLTKLRQLRAMRVASISPRITMD